MGDFLRHFTLENCALLWVGVIGWPRLSTRWYFGWEVLWLRHQSSQDSGDLNASYSYLFGASFHGQFSKTARIKSQHWASIFVVCHGEALVMRCFCGFISKCVWFSLGQKPGILSGEQWNSPWCGVATSCWFALCNSKKSNSWFAKTPFALLFPDIISLEVVLSTIRLRICFWTVKDGTVFPVKGLYRQHFQGRLFGFNGRLDFLGCELPPPKMLLHCKWVG